jgi:hypothetical protein
MRGEACTRTRRTTDGTGWLGQGLGISGAGRYITFPVRAPAIFNGSTFPQVLAIDRLNPDHITVAGGGSNDVGDGGSSFPQVSDNGHVLFATVAPNLSGNVANSSRTVLMVRDLRISRDKKSLIAKTAGPGPTRRAS